MPKNTDAVLAWLDENEKSCLEGLFDWLRMPSIGTDPAYADDTVKAARWAADHLRESGLDVEIMPTGSAGNPGNPIVMATSPGAEDYKGPHVLFYGHYDVQPPDPLDLWDSGPFEPTLAPAIDGGPGERIVARGACDDKGQVCMFLDALRAWKEATGEVAGGVRFTVMLEGEEESGSINLDAFVKEKKDRFKACDVCLICDTGMLGRDRPAITYGVRGMAYTEIILHASNQDLHSGAWGGKVPNPLNELTKLLAKVWDDDRRVTIPGFYDSVVPIEQDERDAWAGLNTNAVEALAGIGLPPEADIGEAGYTAIEREWGRPTCDINGIIGGYTGAGAKTVIPAVASAKVSFRLIANQVPETIRDSFFAWLEERTPPGCRWEFLDHGCGAPATVATDSPSLRAASRAVERASGVRPELIKTGGSLPIAGLLKAEVGLDTVFMGFGLEDDRVHSPNEKFELSCWHMGRRANALLIDEFRGAGT